MTSELNIPEVPRTPAMTTQDYAHARLRNAIMIGAVQPQTTLTIRGLADYLGLSPTPIREAIRRLSSENAIQVLGNRRITIPVMTVAQLEEIVQLRVAVETHAARRALPYVSDIALDALDALDDEMDTCVAEGRHDALTVLNHRFHRMLYTANPHQRVMPIVESIWLQLGPFQRRVIEQLRNFYLVDRHKEIAASLRARDAVALDAAIKADITDGILRTGLHLLQRDTA